MTPNRSATIFAPATTVDVYGFARGDLFNSLEDVKFRGVHWPFVQRQDSGLWIR
jgi:hypothetical protein